MVAITLSCSDAFDRMSVDTDGGTLQYINLQGCCSLGKAENSIYLLPFLLFQLLSESNDVKF